MRFLTRFGIPAITIPSHSAEGMPDELRHRLADCYVVGNKNKIVDDIMVSGVELHNDKTGVTYFVVFTPMRKIQMVLSRDWRNKEVVLWRC